MFYEDTLKLLKARYLRPRETPDEMFRRVAKKVSMGELFYTSSTQADMWEEKFYDAMKNLEFLPNSPTLMNAGNKLDQLAACFVLPVEDSMESIFQSVKDMAIIQKTGGGTGFSFSHLRPKDDIVRSTNGKASGPVSFMRVFNCATESVKQGGKRRGANMGVLSVNHPDIMEFINCKRDKKSFSNFNISVAATDEFFEKLKSNGELELVNPRDKSIWGRLKAQDVFDAIAQAAWETGDPGMLYIDEINRKNPTPLLGKIEATNPCGEVPLLPNEMCTLGSINLSKVINKGSINWGKLKELVHMGVRFLDNVVDLNNYPTKNIERMAKSNRKIGLGVMGFAEALIKLSIPYNSEDAIETAERIMSFINEEAFRASSLLAEERGSFPNIEMSIYKGKKLRNATRTTIAPTGSISMIAQTSPSIEPLFAIAYVKKNILGGKRFIKVNPIFERYARKLTDAEFEEAVKTGSVQGIKDIPENIKRVFVTALDMAPEWHVRMQAAFQKYTDNAVSKTVNLRHDASVEDVKRIYLLGHKLKLKGITIFRYGSKEGVIEFGVKKFDFEKLFKCKTEGCRPI